MEDSAKIELGLEGGSKRYAILPNYQKSV